MTIISGLKFFNKANEFNNKDKINIVKYSLKSAKYQSKNTDEPQSRFNLLPSI